MTSEFLLEAMGLLDDGLILDAERRAAKKAVPLPKLLGWAACLALAAVLGYGISHFDLGMGSGNSAAPAASKPAASAPAASAPAASTPAASTPAAGQSENTGGAGAPQEEYSGTRCPAIMADGVLYWSTGRQIPVEPDPGVIETSDSYTDGEPSENGQNNFSRESVSYAQIDMGLAVLIDGEWVLFTPFPPEE